MKPFQFQKFTINQYREVFRVGTDGVLLGVLAGVSEARNILEVGAGTGLISLMLAQRNSQAKITAIDINKNAVELAKENFESAPFSRQLEIVHGDFKIFRSEEKFDLIISNPPYFEKNSSSKDLIARQRVELDFSELVRKSLELITETGTLSVIIPFQSGEGFEKICSENHLHLFRKIYISGMEKAKPKRLVLEFSKIKKPLVESYIAIEKKPREYSDQYLELTKEFHLFGK